MLLTVWVMTSMLREEDIIMLLLAEISLEALLFILTETSLRLLTIELLIIDADKRRC